MSVVIVNAAPEALVDTTLGELAEYITSGSRDWSKYYAESGAIFIRTQDINQNKLSLEDVAYVRLPERVEGKRSLVKKGDLLITITGANVGKVAALGSEIPEAYVSQSVCLVRLKDPALAKFIQLQLIARTGEKSALEAMAYGLGRPVLNLENIRSAPVKVGPRHLRDRIVSEIEKQSSRLDEAVANLRRVKVNLKRYTAAVLKAAVEGRLVPSGRKWTNTKLGQVAASIRNGYSKKPDAEFGTRIFRISAVRPLYLNVSDVRYLSGPPSEYDPFLVEPGDALFTRYNGSRDYVGVCATVPTGIEPTVYPDKLIRVRVSRDVLLPGFLEIVASTGVARDYIESKIRTTAGQSGISGGDLKSLPLRIPPLSEQAVIVEIVDRHMSLIRQLENELDRALIRVNNLESATLTFVFGGQTDASKWYAENTTGAINV